jgi:ribosomal protein S18 acetylase RimI-like enzyme
MMRFEQLTASDAQRFRALRLRALRDSPEAFGTTHEQAFARPIEEWAEQLAEIPTFVAVRDGADIGLARCACDKGESTSGWLLSVWVAPDARRQGVAGALIDLVVDNARERGMTKLLLDVADTNTGAMELYEQKGFVRTGETTAFPPPRQHIREHRRELLLTHETAD